MEKIRFYDNSTIYEGATDFINQHVIVLVS